MSYGMYSYPFNLTLQYTVVLYGYKVQFTVDKMIFVFALLIIHIFL